jgi:tRNA (guanine37-N1)-methyltransferase
MQISIITLFPQIFTALDYGIPGRAQKNGLITLDYWNPRDFTTDKHRTVDDRPYGGGPGMVLKPEPLQAAIHAAKSKNKHTVVSYLSPQGKLFDQNAAQKLLSRGQLLLVSGRYEGIDERLLTSEIDEEWSIGDFVLSGGELAATCMIDAMIRLIPGALGDAESAAQDSFMNGLLDYPHYTRPEEFHGLKRPAILSSGNHAAIQRWRLQQALGRTWQKRPDLLKKRVLTEEEEVLLATFISEHKDISKN